MTEILTGNSGFLVPPGDVSKLVGLLSRALSTSAAEQRQMREAAQQRAHDRFNKSVVIPELLDVYRETIDSYSLRR
jgi:glycosyltransferase involved in cell wall biosynthesis